MLGTPPQYWYSGSYDAFRRDLAIATDCSAAAELEEGVRPFGRCKCSRAARRSGVHSRRGIISPQLRYHVVEEAPKGDALFSSHLSNREGCYIANACHKSYILCKLVPTIGIVTGPSIGLNGMLLQDPP